MREILFRGKTEKGEWVEGDFSKPCNIIFITIGYDEVLKQNNVEIFNDEKVTPETVGQFTGLTDKNGKKIFEGDIVKFSHPAYEEEIVGAVDWEYNETGYVIREKYGYTTFDYHGEFYEVLGNIHDNPELLEESNEKQTK